MLQPYLLQRVMLDPERHERSSIDELCDFPAMGSDEFGHGALHESLERICAALDSYRLIEEPGLEDRHLRPLVFIAPSVPSEYVVALVRIARRELRPAGETYLAEAVTGNDLDGHPLHDNDFELAAKAWWDLHNDIWFTFDRGLAEKILAALAVVREKESLNDAGSRH